MEDKILELLNQLVEGQNETNERLNETNERLNETNERLNETNERLNETNEKLNETNERLDRIEGKIDSVIEQTADLTEFRTETKCKLESIENEIKQIRQDLNTVEIVTSKNWNEIAQLKAVK